MMHEYPVRENFRADSQAQKQAFLSVKLCELIKLAG